MKAVMEGTKIYPVLGNQDFYPDGQFPPSNTTLIYQAAASLWTDWIGLSAAQSMAQSGYYYVNDTTTGYVVVGLNTGVWHIGDRLTANGTDPLGQFVWLSNVLMVSQMYESVLLQQAYTPCKFQRTVTKRLYTKPKPKPEPNPKPKTKPKPEPKPKPNNRIKIKFKKLNLTPLFKFFY